MTSWTRWGIGMALVFLLMGSVLASSAAAADVVLYEVTEAVATKGAGSRGNGFRSSTATLAGVARTGSPPCPVVIANPVIGGCWVVVRAVGRADDTTGIGPVVGSFEVVVQDQSQTDAPEIAVLRGHVGGSIDLSPAFTLSQPVGTTTGSFTLRGEKGTVMDHQVITGNYVGTFRLPYMVNGQATYQLDGGITVPVLASEYVLGFPAVKLEVTFR